MKMLLQSGAYDSLLPFTKLRAKGLLKILKVFCLTMQAREEEAEGMTVEPVETCWGFAADIYNLLQDGQ